MDRSLLDSLVARVADGYQGGAFETREALADDVVFRDGPDLLEGADAVLDHLAVHGSRRERFEVRDVLHDGDRAAVAYTLAFRADAVAYAQRGTAWLEVRDGLIARWDATWVEVETDLSPWGGD